MFWLNTGAKLTQPPTLANSLYVSPLLQGRDYSFFGAAAAW
jgi:hypothetical protein